ncbi:hypothetical protein HYW87_05055 [Candidatus Roizmanbacteria bacterium]|nr:hypothetical protein [Candidatus Roizmanbacteria bacterium]
MINTKYNIIKKLTEIEKRLRDLETYVYNLDDFMPARTLVGEAMNYIEKKETVSATDLEKRFRIPNMRAQKLIDLFVGYELLSKEPDDKGVRKVNKVAFQTYEEQNLSYDYNENDPLLPKAIETIKLHDLASASLLQRRLAIGYARAAMLIEVLEKKGYVEQANGSKPRKVLKK